MFLLASVAAIEIEAQDAAITAGKAFYKFPNPSKKVSTERYPSTEPYWQINYFPGETKLQRDNPMQLKLRRSQKSGLTGNVTFKLFFIVGLNDEEAAALRKYKFGKLIVYETPKGAAASAGLRSTGGLGGLAATMAAKATNQILSVNDMVDGKEIICKDINEMIAAEEQIRDACLSLSRVLYMCMQFDGEEIIDIEPFNAEA